MDFKITKSKIESYRIRGAHTWADISVDADGTTGRLQIASDFGDWQYYWGSCGCSFKEFMCSLDMHYTANKFGESDWFDVDKTVQYWRRKILGERMRDGIGATLARDCWNDLEGLKHSTSRSEFEREWFTTPYLHREYEFPECITDVSPHFRKFWETLWPAFVAHLKAEINEAKPCIPSTP